MTKIIAGFPGVGKTTMGEGERFYDLESTPFRWIEEREEIKTPTDMQGKPLKWAKARVELEKQKGVKGKKKANPDFPANYINKLKELLASGEYDYIFTSTHDEVLKAINEEGYGITIVAPDNTKENKIEFIGRYLKRGNNYAFIDLLNKKWDAFLADIANNAQREGNELVRISKDEYVSDLFDRGEI